MHFSIILIAAVLAVGTTQAADLHCLTIAWWSPIIGAICYFKPELFTKAEETVVKDVEDAVEDVKDLVKFELKYNAFSVAYRAINATVHGGARAGAAELGDTGRAYLNLGIGIDKGLANTVVKSYDIFAWHDVSWCLIKGGASLVSQNKRKLKRDGRPFDIHARDAARPSDDDAKAMAKKCFSDKFNKIARPAYFNITDPNQEIGASISQVATLLVPVAPEAKVGEVVAEGTYDLAIAGSEDVRILKNLGDDVSPGHFTSFDEAESVKDYVRDEKWFGENCGTCPQLSGGALTRGAEVGVTATSRVKRQAMNFLRRRGAAFSACCKVPQTKGVSNPFADALSSEDDPFADHPSIPLEDLDRRADSVASGSTGTNMNQQPRVKVWSGDEQQKLFDAGNYAKLVEEDIVPSPQYTVWDLSDASNVAKVQSDLEQLNTAVVSFSPEMKAIYSSEDLSKLLRKTFTGPVDDPIYKKLQVYERNGRKRLATVSNHWIDGTEPEMKPLRDFANAMVDHAKNTVVKLKGFSPEEAAKLDGNVEFFWCAAGDDALRGGIDPRGLHVDNGLMQFGLQDTEGLVLKNRVTNTISRPPVVKDAVQLVKAHFWDAKAELGLKPQGATPHGVFGSQMAENGRFSMVTSVFWKDGPSI